MGTQNRVKIVVCACLLRKALLYYQDRIPRWK